LHSYSSRHKAPAGATVVLDTGSSLLRAGFAGEGMPRIVAAMDGGRHVGSCAAIVDCVGDSSPRNQHAMAAAAQESSVKQQMQAPFSIDWEKLEETWEW
jgi:actin-related protein